MALDTHIHAQRPILDSMLFTSLQFGLFFIVVGVLYFVIPQRFRWMLLLAASYYFYACWKVGYLALIAASTAVTYLTGLGIGASPRQKTKRGYLIASVAVNLGLIAVFKYFNFFNGSFRALFAALGLGYGIPNLDVLLPVGISFYTFQALSYTIDVYRGDKSPERHLGIFALYIAFFPQLVAGPIERSTRLLPQFFETHRLNYERIAGGLSLMLWGFFKKLVIADRLALYVNEVYNHPEAYGSTPALLATYFFAFQIYCDFSGYSDIAIGAARVFGYNLMTNFKRPYAATSIGDFWRRWHISLSTWFKDYLYIPLGGNRCTTWRWVRNLFLVFIISGLWHGAAWTFVVWGGLHFAFFLGAIVTHPLRRRIAEGLKLHAIPVVPRVVQVLWVFHLVTVAWIFFRANTLADAWLIIKTIGECDWRTTAIAVPGCSLYEVKLGAVFILLMEVAQFVERKRGGAGFFTDWPAYVRWPLYYALIACILVFGNFRLVEFIYFQF